MSLEICCCGKIAPTFKKEVRQVEMAMLGEKNLIIDQPIFRAFQPLKKLGKGPIKIMILCFCSHPIWKLPNRSFQIISRLKLVMS